MSTRAQHILLVGYVKKSVFGRPQDWNILDDEEKKKWNETADNLEQFYRDMRTHRHHNTGLSKKWMTTDEERSHENARAQWVFLNPWKNGILRIWPGFSATNSNGFREAHTHTKYSR